MIPELMIALSVGAALFGVGLYGALSQTNLVMIIMGVELILAAALLNLVAFWRYLPWLIPSPLRPRRRLQQCRLSHGLSARHPSAAVVLCQRSGTPHLRRSR